MQIIPKYFLSVFNEVSAYTIPQGIFFCILALFKKFNFNENTESIL